MRQKSFRLPADGIKPIATGFGACFATDRITVDGCRVGYMYRESPGHDTDGGWRFFAGDETDEYMDEPSNHGVYDVNTIANYDADIIPLLDSAEGTAFARDDSGSFVPVEFRPAE